MIFFFFFQFKPDGLSDKLLWRVMDDHRGGLGVIYGHGGSLW
jgi:hypothetical protein